ncbi:hypothetical protein V1264_012686 [Littorina saxatilis]|uniref:Uncharacterized protein n=1 Tax=Littorina saxatilis TaxID=31220 RepID=A0AAN9GLT3_9CAEN
MRTKRTFREHISARTKTKETMEESLNDLRRQIASGLLYLTVPEDDALQALLAVFPQYSMWSLSAVVALHSHQFLSSADSLVQCCMEFLLGEDGETLTPFLCPWTYNDEPEAFAGGNLQSEASTSSSFATASSSATMGQQLGSAPSSLKASTSNLNLTSSASPTVVKSQPLPSNISATVLMTTSSASASSDFAQATATVTTATVGNPSVMCETLSASAPNTCTSLPKKLHQTSPVTMTPRSADLLPASVSTELIASDSSKTLTEQIAASSNSIVNGPSCLSHTSSPSSQKSTLGSAKPPVFTQTSGSASTSRKHDVSYDAETAMSRDLDSPTASEDSNVSLPVSLHELPASGEASYNRSGSCNFLEDSDVAMSATPSPDLPAGLLDSDVSSRESSSNLPMPVLPKQSVAGGSTCTAGVSLSSDLSVSRSPPLVDDDFSISEPAPLNDTDSDISPQESSNELPALPKELKSRGSPGTACVSTPDLSVGKLAPVVAVVTKSSASAGRFGEIQARGGGSWRESSTLSSTSGFGCDFEDDSDELETDASVDRILSSLSSHYKGSSRKPKPQPQTVANLGVHVRGGSLKIELDSMSDSASDKAKPAAVEIFDDSSCDSLPDIAFIVKPKLEAKDVGIKTEPKARNEQSKSDGVTSKMYRSKEEIIGSSSDSQHSFSSNGSDLPDLPDFCSQSQSAPKMKSENTGNCSKLVAFTCAGGSRHTPAVALRSGPNVKQSFSSASQDLSPVSEFSVCSKVKVTKKEKLPIDPYNVAQTASSVIGCEGIDSNSGSKKKKIPSANHNLCRVASSLLNKRKATGSKKKAVPAAYEGGPVNRKTSGNTGTACSSFNAESLPSLSPPKRKRPVFNEERPDSSAKTPARPPVSVSHSSRPDMSGSISSGVKYLGKNSSFCGTQVASPTPLPASSSSTAGSGISVFPPSSVHDLSSKPGNPYATESSAKQYMGQIRSNHSSATTRASASTSTAAASATSVSMPDTRDNLQKRMDRLDAQILGLIGTTNNFRADFTSNQPFRGLDQIPDSSLVNTELRSLAPRPRMRTHQSAPARTAVKAMAKMFDESSGLTASSQLSTGKMPTPLKSASIPVSTGYDLAAPVVKSVTVRLVDPPRSVPNKSDSPETRMKTGYVFAAPVGLNPPPSVPNQSDSLPSSSTSLAKPSKKGKSKKTKADATQPAPATGSGSVNTTPAQGNVNTAQSQGNSHTHSVANSSLKGMAKPANTPSLMEAGAAVHRATFGVPTPSSAVVQPPAAGLASGARPVVNPGIWGWRDKRAGQAAGVINVDSETVLDDR